ncbi:MAG: MFS transporter [Verrucomicrobia bacterium]|nr:MFS transporter [Verrucomicrobiota bacterium]
MNLWQDPKARLILTGNFLLVVGSGITWVAVPWLLIHQPNGDAIFGLSNSALTLLIFLLLPFLGKAIDRHSRKKVLILYYAVGISTNLFVIAMILLQGHVAPWHLVVSISMGSLGISVYYPVQFAFNQEVLARDQYSALSGAIEVQWQAGAMIAGGLASFLISRTPLTWILLFDTGTFTAALVVLAFVPYRRNSSLDANVGSAWKLMLEGLGYLRVRPRLSSVLFGSYLPFLRIMIGGYLLPLFIKITLHAGPEVYGLAEVFYSSGALLAGLIVPSLGDRIGWLATLLLTVGCYTVSVVVNPLCPGVVVLLGSLVLQGLGNAGSRVARSTMALQAIPNELIGRVNLFYSALERLLRAIFLAVVTQQVATTDPKSGYWTMASIGLTGWITIFCCRRFRHEKVIPAFPSEEVL